MVCMSRYADSLSPTHGNGLDDEKYYRSDFRHPTESHSHNTYKAAASNGIIINIKTS